MCEKQQRKGAEDQEKVRGETFLGEVHMQQLIRRSLCVAGCQRYACINTNMLKNVYVRYCRSKPVLQEL